MFVIFLDQIWTKSLLLVASCCFQVSVSQVSTDIGRGSWSSSTSAPTYALILLLHDPSYAPTTTPTSALISALTSAPTSAPCYALTSVATSAPTSAPTSVPASTTTCFPVFGRQLILTFCIE